MAFQRKAGGGEHSRGFSGVENVGAAAIDAEEEKLSQPCFEGYLNGAWWEVDIVQRRSEMFLVRYVHLPDGEEAWVPLNHLRLRARKSDDWDCGILRRGTDVSVYAVHPQAGLLDPHNTTKALYDAKILSVTKFKHQLDCCCKFFVRFFSIEENQSPKPGVERMILSDYPSTEVDISKLSILQQPGITPLHEVIKAHISGQWDAEQGRWSNDAFWLKETELGIFRTFKGEDSTTIPPSNIPPDILSEEDVTHPVLKPETKSAHHLVGIRGPKLSGPKNDAAQIFRGRETVEMDHRNKKSSATLGMKYRERGIKRKHDAVDEKEISNVVQEDYSPGVSSRLFGRSEEKVEARRQDRNVGRDKTSKGDPRQYKLGRAVERKRGRRLKMEDSDSSPEENLLDNSQERIVDSSHNSERGSNRDGLLRRGRAEEGHVAKKHLEHRSSKHDMQKPADQVLKSRPSGPNKPEKFSDRIARRLQVEEDDQGRPFMPTLEKGSSLREDLRRGKLDEEQPGRKRGRPRGSTTGTSKHGGGYEWKDIESPKGTKVCTGRPKHCLESELENGGSPITNFKSNNVTGLGGNQDIETDRELGRRGSKGRHGPYPKPEKVSMKVSSDKQQKVSPVKEPSRKEPSKKEDEKVNNDPDLGKSDGYFSTPSPKSEDPSSEASPQLLKLRPRSSGRLKKLHTRSQSNKSNKISSTRLQKDAENEKRAPEKVMDRPLYMDLLENNGEDEDNGEKPSPVGEQKPTFGVSSTWDPVVDDTNSDLSDSDAPLDIPSGVSDKNPLMQKLFEDNLTLPSAVTPAGMEQVAPVAGEGDGQAEACEGDQDTKVCEHSCVLKDDVGLVCLHCGIVSVPIEEVVPEVDCTQRRAHDADLDEWDLGRRSPDINQGATGYDQVENMDEVTMLNTCLPPHYAQQMHPHQKEGFEFLWRNLAYSDGKLRSRKNDKNAGCILSHAPGTGKSFLVIAFLKSYIDKFPGSRPLIVAPKIMLLRWEKEFARWKSDIKVLILNTAAVTGKRLIQKHEESGVISLKSHQMNPRNVDTCRMATLFEWKKRRSVLLVSYNLFSSLTDEDGCNRSQEGKAIRKSLLESPDILILDEGHFPRNKDTRIRKALMNVRTKRRILLSGTLFQNNFEEFFNTLYLVRAGFVEAFSSCKIGLAFDMSVNEIMEEPANDQLAMEEVTDSAEKKARKLFMEEIGEKIEEGQLCKGSEVLQHGLQRLQRLTANFVHHHTGGVLACLPGLRDFGILLKPTALQCSLLAMLEQAFQKPEEYLKREIAVSAGSIHPNLLTKFDFVKGDILNSLMEQGGSGMPQCDLGTIIKEPTVPEDGVKTKFVFDLLHSLKSKTEKVLIFSQHMSPLDLLENMFKAAFNWDKHKDVLRLDGKMAMNERESVIERFNDPNSQAKILLASTKACGEGINLVGASRVVFLDVLWNPAVIKQAISRAFRLGQKKTVYVYRLIAIGTIEEKKYKKAIRKDWLSTSIFCPVAGEADEDDEQPKNEDDEQPKNEDDEQPKDEDDEQPKEISCLKDLSPAEDIQAWEVDGDTCEDDLLEKLLSSDKGQANSFVKVVEHGSQFHHRKTSCGPDARDWFLDDLGYKDLSHVKETREGEQLGIESTNPENLASKVYQDFGEIGAFDTGVASSSDTDEEYL